jgi:DNA repair exonuclease SbcCD ATPase subunit
VLNRIEVTDFQSLHRAVIPLGRLTVITGPTGSGKSALFRAMVLLARNARGTSYISAGSKTCSVATGNDRWAVRITRSSAPRGKNEYSVAKLVPVPAQDPGEGWSGCKYTKLNSQVPAPVAEMLQLTDVNFARQADPPYLLSIPGTEIARRLGDLTNVSLVLGAAQEAGRVRKQLVRDLDMTRARREALLEEAQEFAGLGARRKACTAAEEALARAEATAARRDRLRVLSDRLAAAEHAVAAARAEADRQAPPRLDRLEVLTVRRARLTELAGGLQAAERDAARYAGLARDAQQDEKTAREAVHAALARAGQCPVCGSTIT